MRTCGYKMLLLLLALLASPGSASAEIANCVSGPEFRNLAAELAPKVNLFAEAWKADPQAEFFGGTTRDYLYWLKGKFQDCKNPQEGRAISAELKSQAVIDVREFIVGDSDVDIVSKAHLALDADRYGVKKIDSLSPEIFDPASDRGKNELVQGYIPAEKIRLGKDGIHAPADFGDGVGEIYSGKVTVHFTPKEVFAQGHYAAQKINHPILLALRYQRLLGINYFRAHGAGLPQDKLLFDIDPASEKAVREVMNSAGHADSLVPYLEKAQFLKWLNGSIQKSFRSYTNPTAAKKILEHFGVDQLAKQYAQIEPLNQYVFQKYRDEPKIAGHLKALKTSPAALYQDGKSFFPDGYLYHGTKTEDAFRGILLQGFLPSSGGSAGAGLYGVARKDKQFAEIWGEQRDRLVRIEVKPHAKVVDLTRGEGQRAFREFQRAHRGDEEAFANAVGADIIKYPYTTDAYVVENSAVLGKPEGVYRKVITLRQAGEMAKQVNSFEKLLEFGNTLALNRFDTSEISILAQQIPRGWESHLPSWEKNPALAANLLEQIGESNSVAAKYLALDGSSFRDFLAGAVRAANTAEDFERLKRYWQEDAPVSSPAELQAMIKRLEATDALKQYGPPYKTAEDIAEKLLEFRKDGLHDALRAHFKPAVLHALESMNEKQLVKFLNGEAYPRAAPLAEYLTDVERKALVAHWTKTGPLNFFTTPSAETSPYLQRISLLLRWQGPLGLDIQRESFPKMRELARHEFPPIHVPSFFGKDVAEIRGAVAVAALQGDAPREQTMSDMGKFFEASHGSSTDQIFSDYLVSPEGQQDDAFWRRLLAEEKSDEGVRILLGSLSAPTSPFRRAFGSEDVLTRFLPRLYNMWDLKNLLVLRQGLDELRAKDEAGYLRTMHGFLEKDLTAMNPDSGYAASFREAIWNLLPNAAGDPVWKDPLAARALGLLVKRGPETVYLPKFLKFLSLPEVAHLPEATAWLEEVIAKRSKTTEEANRLLDEQLPNLLKAPPWRDHPRRAMWEAALKLEPIQVHVNTFTSWVSAPRKEYIKRHQLLAFGDKAAVEKWRLGLMAGSGASPVGGAAACSSWFGRLVGKK